MECDCGTSHARLVGEIQPGRSHQGPASCLSLLCIQETTDRNRAANLHVELISCMEEYQFSQRKAARRLSSRLDEIAVLLQPSRPGEPTILHQDPLVLGQPRIAGAVHASRDLDGATAHREPAPNAAYVVQVLRALLLCPAGFLCSVLHGTV